MPTSPTLITALPTPPSRNDSATFSARGDAFLGALPTFRTETNAVATVTYNNAVEVASNTSTVAANTTLAQNAASSAAASAGASIWVSGTTYSIGDVRYSPANGQIYRRLTAGGGTTDPSADGTNWTNVFAFTFSGSNATLAGSLTLSGGTANGVLYLNGSKVATSGSALVFDGTNLGLGVTPSAWTIFRAMQIGNGYGVMATTSGVPSFYMLSNAFYDGAYKYIGTGYASEYYQYQGAHVWRTAPSGTAGNAITFTQALTVDANVNLLLNGTTAPASGVGTFAIFNGTAPTGSVTNGCVLYTEDVSSSSELKVRDEAGNVTTLSPHNFSLIPEGASEDMAWAYYSEKNGKRINVDMLKLARMVEKLTGEKLVYEA